MALRQIQLEFLKILITAKYWLQYPKQLIQQHNTQAANTLKNCPTIPQISKLVKGVSEYCTDFKHGYLWNWTISHIFCKNDVLSNQMPSRIIRWSKIYHYRKFAKCSNVNWKWRVWQMFIYVWSLTLINRFDWIDDKQFAQVPMLWYRSWSLQVLPLKIPCDYFMFLSNFYKISILIVTKEPPKVTPAKHRDEKGYVELSN